MFGISRTRVNLVGIILLKLKNTGIILLIERKEEERKASPEPQKEEEPPKKEGKKPHPQTPSVIIIWSAFRSF